METDKNKLIGEDDASVKEMSFLDHLEELRWRIIYSLIGLIVGTIIAWIFINFFVEKVLLVPAIHANLKLQNLRPFGQLFMYLQIAFVIGGILSIPNFFYQFWKFISPALKEKEKKYVTLIVSSATFCFLTGIVFGYFVMTPMTLKFAAQFGTRAIENNIAIKEYLSIILSILIGSGVVFELPVLSFILSKIGVLSPQLMRKYWRHSIVVILFLAAVLTPGTDPVSQIFLAVPLVLLYEISIFVSKLSYKKS